MEKPAPERQLDPCLLPFLNAKDEEEELYLTQLLGQVKPTIEKITRQSKNPEDAFQKWAQRVTKSLRDCKADPVGSAIEKYEHYVAVVAKNVILGEIRKRSPESTPTSAGDDEDERPQSERLQSSDLQPDEEVEVKEFLEHLWAGIERLSPPQRIAYLLNFTDGEGELAVFWEAGVASARRVAATLQLADEHFARLWSALELNEEERHRVAALTTSEEKFAWLWLKRYLPLEDQVIARMLGKERQQVINLRAVARRTLAEKLAVWRRRS